MSDELVELVEVKPALLWSDKDRDVKWMFPKDVVAVLDLMGYTFYGAAGGEEGLNCFCDIWKRDELAGMADAIVGRVFNSKWSNTQREAIDQVVEWVRAGMPDGFGEATGGKF